MSRRCIKSDFAGVRAMRVCECSIKFYYDFSTMTHQDRYHSEVHRIWYFLHCCVDLTILIYFCVLLCNFFVWLDMHQNIWEWFNDVSSETFQWFILGSREIISSFAHDVFEIGVLTAFGFLCLFVSAPFEGNFHAGKTCARAIGKVEMCVWFVHSHKKSRWVDCLPLVSCCCLLGDARKMLGRLWK